MKKQKIFFTLLVAGQMVTTVYAQNWLTSGNLSTKTDTLGTRTNQSNILISDFRLALTIPTYLMH